MKTPRPRAGSQYPTFALYLADGRVVEQRGADATDAVRRYVRAHGVRPVAAELAHWRYEERDAQQSRRAAEEESPF